MFSFHCIWSFHTLNIHHFLCHKTNQSIYTHIHNYLSVLYKHTFVKFCFYALIFQLLNQSSTFLNQLHTVYMCFSTAAVHKMLSHSFNCGGKAPCDLCPPAHHKAVLCWSPGIQGTQTSLCLWSSPPSLLLYKACAEESWQLWDYVCEDLSWRLFEWSRAFPMHQNTMIFW